jgi:hypothetical protein
MTTIRQEIAMGILKLNPRDRDALADVVGLGVCALISLGCLVFSGYGLYRFFHFLGVL